LLSRNGRVRISEGEEERLSETRSTGDRLAEVGILAAGLAHELNNPIGSILLAAKNARAAPDRVEECLDTIQRNARRCAAVVRDVLDVARTQSNERVPVDPNGVARRAVESAAGAVSERHATVSLELAPGLPSVEANAVELERAIANLVRNAAESGDGVQIRVETGVEPGGVRIAVTDDGCGIPEERRERVFEPFFTTRQDDGGTGLGLSLARAVVHAHGGRIDLRGAPGEGTRASVVLPAATGG
jgi:two-component system NtrC family sensor kinase